MQTKLESGHEYEVYVKNIIKNKYKNTWLWTELPKEVLLEIECIKNINDSCDDIGCDIVCQYHDDSYVFIQCKNYSTTGIDNTINISDLSGFYNFIAETGYTGIVYYSGKLSNQIILRKKKITYINLPHIKNNKVLDFKPYEYQIEAYNKLKNNNRAILAMPCGTGKTFVSFLLSLDYTNIIILTPLISTTDQILSHYKNYYSEYNDINYILVNCKATRKIDNLKNKNIIASTYDSTNNILPILDKLDKVLIIIDEFHNISNNMITEDNDMNKLLKSTADILFMSATPKEHDIFGNVKYILSWDVAISNKYICDYNFYYPDNSKIITKIEEMKFDTSIIEKTILINKAYYLLESIKECNIRKCIVYLKTINEADEFEKILKTLNIYFNHSIKVYNINYNTSNNTRNKYLTKFQYDDSYINIMCNVHILDEGIDIPSCDSIYLTHPNNNPTNIIQRISRANRLDSSNKDKIAKIFLWTKNKTNLDNIISNISTVIKVKYGFDNFDNSEVININKDITYNDNINNKKLLGIYDRYNLEYIFDINQIIWFRFTSIANLLNYKDKKDTLKRYIDDSDKKYLKDINYNAKININIINQPLTRYITEYGLHRLILNSHMPNSIEFKKLLIQTSLN
jgi:superfamily II DNA or RNA helicase